MKGWFLAFYRFNRELNRSGLSSGYWKYFFRWKNDLLPGKSSIQDRQPWFGYPFIHYLRNYLKPDMKVFEYGGGGSTLFFLSRMQINTVITAEHDGTWFHELEKTIRNLGLSGWKGMYLPPENSASVADPSDPSGYISNHPDFRGMEFGKYARSIDAFDNNFFDLVLIDGRARPSCLFHAISKVKSGGLLILDNSEREYYTKNSQGRINTLFTVEMDGFAPVPYNDWFSKTTIWKKK